jgi:predicted PurR-regulated permease PerM
VSQEVRADRSPQPLPGGDRCRYRSVTTARKAAIAAAAVVGVVVLALALWKIRVLIALLFLGLVISAAMRPGVEWLHTRRIPRGVGVTLHYLVFAGVIGLLLWLIVPHAIDQVQQALGGKTAEEQVKRVAAHTDGLDHRFFVALDRELRDLPSGAALLHPAMTVTRTVLEVIVGIFFTFAVAAYWIFEREQAEKLVLSLVPPEKRDLVRATWHLIDEKLGAFVRGQLLMIAFVSTVLSAAFWAIGLPYWLLLGVFAGIVEMVPVIGPLLAGGVAIGVGLTQSWQAALLVAIAVYGLRLLQDYVINPHVLGRAVGLSPLIVLVTVSVVGLVFGPFYVLLSVPLAAVVATLVDVIVLARNPAEEPVPAVIFPAKDRAAS